MKSIMKYFLDVEIKQCTYSSYFRETKRPVAHSSFINAVEFNLSTVVKTPCKLLSRY